MKTFLRVTMPDGSIWEVPVSAIARHRALHYAHEFGGSVERSLTSDTLPLFRRDAFAIRDWAENQMQWDDVKDVAVCVKNSPPIDFESGWVNGTKHFV